MSSHLPICINAGGAAITDKAGNQWDADSFYNNGGQAEQLWNPVTTIYGTADGELYMTARYDPPSLPALTYDIPVPNGDYEVVLGFAELYSKAMYKGARIFNVMIEQKAVFQNMDIYADAGAFTVLKKTANVNVNDGNCLFSLVIIRKILRSAR